MTPRLNIPYFRPRILGMVFLWIAGGLPFLLITSTFVQWLTEEGVSKTAYANLIFYITLPYSLKILWAHIVHQVKLPLSKTLGHYRAWILWSQIALISSLIFLGFSDPATDLARAQYIGMMVSFFSSTHDIAMGGYRIHSFSDEEQGYASGATAWGFRIGILLAGPLALKLSSSIDWSYVYLSIASIMTVGCIAVFFMTEPKVTQPQDIAAYNLWKVAKVIYYEFFKRTPWALVLLYIITFKLGDAIMNSFTWRFFNELGFDKTHVANAAFVGFFPMIIGSGLGGYINSRFNIFWGMVITAGLQILSSLIFYYQSLTEPSLGLMTSTLAFENFYCGFGTATIYTVFALITTKNYAAIQFAFFTAFASLMKGYWVKNLGSIATEIPWSSFFLFTAFVGWLSFLLIYQLSRHKKVFYNKSE